MFSMDTFENDGGDLSCSACGIVIHRDEEVTITDTSVGLRLTCKDCQEWIEKAVDRIYLEHFERIRKTGRRDGKQKSMFNRFVQPLPGKKNALRKGGDK